MEVPSMTQAIFDYLRQGLFLSANATSAAQQEMYQQVRRHEETLRTYFAPLGLQLEQGPGYYYFAHQQGSTALTDQVEKLSKWFDAYFFFKTYDRGWGPGSTLVLPDLVDKVEAQPALSRLLSRISLKGNPTSPSARLSALLRKWERASFLQQVQETPLTYEVLDAVDYLQQLILTLPTEARGR